MPAHLRIVPLDAAPDTASGADDDSAQAEQSTQLDAAPPGADAGASVPVPQDAQPADDGHAAADPFAPADPFAKVPPPEAGNGKLKKLVIAAVALFGVVAVLLVMVPDTPGTGALGPEVASPQMSDPQPVAAARPVPVTSSPVTSSPVAISSVAPSPEDPVLEEVVPLSSQPRPEPTVAIAPVVASPAPIPRPAVPPGPEPDAVASVAAPNPAPTPLPAPALPVAPAPVPVATSPLAAPPPQPEQPPARDQAPRALTLPAPAEVPSAAPPANVAGLLEELTLETVHALRAPGGADLADAERSLFGFVRSLQPERRSLDQIATMLQRAADAGTLQVPAKYLRPDGRVNAADVLRDLAQAQ